MHSPMLVTAYHWNTRIDRHRRQHGDDHLDHHAASRERAVGQMRRRRDLKRYGTRIVCRFGK
jgi:hypothetical protein